MSRAVVVGGGAAALGVALAISGALAPGRAPAAAADTAITSRSIAFFERRLARDPGNFLVAGALATRYLMRFQVGADLGDVERAEAVARGALPLAADTAAALARLSVIYLTQHKFVPAYVAAGRAVASDPADRDALGALFDAAMAQGRYAEAESALARLAPGRLDYQLRLAHFLTALGRTDGAYYTLDRACRQLERSQVPPQGVAWCLTELAHLQRTRAGAPAAAALLERALEIQPGYRGAVEGLADLAYARGDWRGAERLYRRIAADAHPDLYLRLAEVRAAQGDSAGAREHEVRFLSVARAPGAEALYARPLALYYAAQPETCDSAAAVARRDVARRPAVESWDVLGWVLLECGEPAAALAASDRARAWGAPSPTMDFHRARILAALGRGDEAVPLERAALTDPGLLAPHAQQELRRLGLLR